MSIKEILDSKSTLFSGVGRVTLGYTLDKQWKHSNELRKQL